VPLTNGRFRALHGRPATRSPLSARNRCTKPICPLGKGPVNPGTRQIRPFSTGWRQLLESALLCADFLCQNSTPESKLVRTKETTFLTTAGECQLESRPEPAVPARGSLTGRASAISPGWGFRGGRRFRVLRG